MTYFQFKTPYLIGGEKSKQLFTVDLNWYNNHWTCYFIPYFIIKETYMQHNLQRNTYYRDRHLYVYAFLQHLLCDLSICSFIGRHKFCPTLMDFCCSKRWLLSFLPPFDLKRKGNSFKLLKYHLNVFFVKQSILSIFTYSVDAAATGDPCSTGNNSQTPSRYNRVLTLELMGPCCQSPPNERNTDGKVNLLDMIIF